MSVQREFDNYKIGNDYYKAVYDDYLEALEKLLKEPEMADYYKELYAKNMA